MSSVIKRALSYSPRNIIKSSVDTYVLYTIVKRIAKPFNQWNAYKLGVIDDKGNILIDKDKRTDEQYKSLTYLDIFVRNIKRILQIVPGLNSRIITYSAALWLLREDRYIEMDMLCEDGETVIANTSSHNITDSSQKQAKAFKNNISSRKYKKNNIDFNI